MGKRDGRHPLTLQSAHGASRQADRALRAILLLTFAYLCWSSHDAVIKLLTGHYGFAQILFFGRVLTVPTALVLAMRQGGIGSLRTAYPLRHISRGLMVLIDGYCFIGALALAPMADVFTISFITPLIMMVMSTTILGERPPWRRWVAVIAGFIGVIVVLQPSGAGYGMSSLLALGSSVAYAAYLVLTRAMTRTESVPALVFWNSLLVLSVMAVLMIPGWQTPSGADLWCFVYLAVTGAIGQLCTTEAYRLGEASLLAPMQYISLIWASLFGYLIFGDVPTSTLWAGAAIIITAAIYIVRDEARGSR